MANDKPSGGAQHILGAIGAAIGMGGVKVLGPSSWMPIIGMTVFGAVFGAIRKRQNRPMSIADGAVVVLAGHTAWMAMAALFFDAFDDLFLDLGFMATMLLLLLWRPSGLTFAFSIAVTSIALYLTLPIPPDAKTEQMQALATHTVLRLGFMALLVAAWVKQSKQDALDPPATGSAAGGQTSSMASGAFTAASGDTRPRASRASAVQGTRANE